MSSVKTRQIAYQFTGRTEAQLHYKKPNLIMHDLFL